MYQVVRVYQHHNNQRVGYIRVSCDTDFVGRNEEFLKFVDDFLMGIVGLGEIVWINELFFETNPVTERVFGEDIIEARKKFGENIRVIEYNVFLTEEEQQKLWTEKEIHGESMNLGRSLAAGATRAAGMR